MNLSNLRVLVSGAKGFVGKMLSQRLTDIGLDVIEVDLKQGFDITNWHDVVRIPKTDVVFHLAALTDVSFSFNHPLKTYTVNVQGTLHILEYARICRVQKFIYTSSYVYGKPNYIPIDECHSVQPASPYNASKVLGEKLCKYYNRHFGLEVIVLRPFNIYGPGQNSNFLISSIIQQALHSRQICLRDPRPKRDFLYVDDFVEAYIKALNYSTKGFNIFNIGSGISFSVEEVVQKIIFLTGKCMPVFYSGEKRQNEILNAVADISRAKEILKWQPRFTLDEGLQFTISAFKNI